MAKKLYKQQQLSDMQQSMVRVALQYQVLFCERHAAVNEFFARRAAEFKAILDLMYGHDIAVTNDNVCERCEYMPCVCGTEDFEMFVSSELAKAEDREVL